MAAVQQPLNSNPLMALVRQEIPILVWVLADISLLVPLFLVIMPWSRHWPAWLLAGLMALLILVPFNLARAMSLWGVAIEIQRRLLGAGLVITLVLALRQLLFTPESIFSLSWVIDFFDHLTIAGYPYWLRDFGLIGLVLYTWWRGITLPERSFSIEWIGLQFRLRALILAPLIILFGGRRLIGDITPFLVLFGVSHLVMIALARAEEIQRRETGLAFFLSPYWFGTVLAASVVVVGTSWFLASSAGTDTVSSSPQSGILLLTLTTFYALIYFIAPVVFPLLEWLTGFIGRLAEPIFNLLASFSIEPIAEDTVPEFDVPQAPEAAGLLAQLASYLPAIVFLAVLGGIIFFIIWWYQQMAAGAGTEGGREGIDLERGRLGDDLDESLWDRLRQVIPGLRGWRAARSIRRIYYQMVYAAEHRGVPRRPAQTPYEFLPDLEQIWPAGQAETRLITNAYVRVRYGQIPEKKEELQAILGAWETLKNQLLEGE